MAFFNVSLDGRAKNQNKMCHRKMCQVRCDKVVRATFRPLFLDASIIFSPDQTNNNYMVRSFSASKSCISLVLQSNCVYTGRPYDDVSYLTEVAGEGGTNWAPQKFLLSQKFRHLMG